MALGRRPPLAGRSAAWSLVSHHQVRPWRVCAESGQQGGHRGRRRRAGAGPRGVRLLLVEPVGPERLRPRRGLGAGRAPSGSRGPTGPAYAASSGATSTRGRPRTSSARSSTTRYDADLTLAVGAAAVRAGAADEFGFSPASADWELFSQSTDGAVITLRMPDDTDFGDLADRLDELGYPPPESDDGVWAGGPDLLSALSPNLTPELAYVVLDRDEHLVLASDQQAYLEAAVRAATGDGDGVDGLDVGHRGAGRPAVGGGLLGRLRLRRAGHGPGRRRRPGQAAELVAAAGTVDPYLAFAMGVRPEGEVRVAMEFADDDQARVNADSRAALATGPGRRPGWRLRRPLRRCARPSRTGLSCCSTSTPRRRVRPQRPHLRPRPLRHLLSRRR